MTETCATVTSNSGEDYVNRPDSCGPAAAVAELLAQARLPAEAEQLGPVPAGDDRERMLVRVPRRRAPELAAALRDAAAVRSVRKAADPVRIQVDPLTLF